MSPGTHRCAARPNAAIAALRGMSLAELGGMIPPEGLQLCEPQAESVGQVFRSPTRGGAGR